jgi:hypothetical protein
MKRKRLRVALGATALALAVVAMVAVPSCWRSPVSRANVFRVQVGMRPSEVQAILGYPSKIFPANPAEPSRPGPVWQYHSPVPLAVPSEDWPGERDDVEREWLVHVDFDSAGVVWNVSYCASPVPPRSSWFHKLWPF